MDFLMNLHVVMSVVAVILLFLSWRLYQYRAVLQHAVRAAIDPAVKETLDVSIHRKNTERAQEELSSVNGLKVPCFQAGLLCLGGLWLGLAYEVADTTLVMISAGIIAAVATMLLSHRAVPTWLMDWVVAMTAAVNQAEAKDIQKKMLVIVGRLQTLIAKAEEGQLLTDDESMDVVRATITVQAYERRLVELARASESINEYSAIRKHSLNDETD